MNYFISDLHLGHKNAVALNFRPFESWEEMDETLINNWNNRVKSDDVVYILGDLVWQSCDPEKYLQQLSGRKILITGNHDEKWLNRGDYSNYFELVTPYLETKIDGLTVTLCHYPMVEWKASRKIGSKKLGYHIHGHIHNGWKDFYRGLFLAPHALNAGADILNFTPATFEELVKFNESHKLSFLPSLEDKAEFLANKYHLYRSDKSGKPYVEHLKYVNSLVVGEVCKTVALLHDILEDTDIDPALLERIFPYEIVEAVKIMTRRPEEDYFEYINRVSLNPVTRSVKLADLTHNMDLTRLKSPTEADLARQEKYAKAYAILKNS